MRTGLVRLVAGGALLGTTALLGASAGAADQTQCEPGGTVEDVGRGWLALRPAFTAGPAAVTLLAAPSYDSNLLYATNGSVLMRSEDAGCGWTTVWSASSAPGLLPGAVGQITALHVPSSANNSSFVYVGVTGTLGALTSPYLVVSRDRGGSFTAAGLSEGLPATGEVTEVVVNPSIPQIGYAVVTTQAAALGTSHVYGTSDAGTTWTNRTGEGGLSTVTSLQADPVGQTSLFGIDDGAVVHSDDGGATFARVPGTTGGPVAALVSASGAGGLRLATRLTGQADVPTSVDAGASWSHIPTPFTPSSVGLGPLRGVVGVSDSQRLLLIDAAAPTRPNDVTPGAGGAPGALGLSAPTGVGFAVVGLRDGVVLRVAVDAGLRPIVPPPGQAGLPIRPVALQPAGPLTQFPSTLLPASVTITLPPGGSARLPYDLLVPRTPTPVDLMFLVDSTASMSGIIEALKSELRSIVTALNESGLDVRFGIGNYNDYPDPHGTGDRSSLPYVRNIPVSPYGTALSNAINGIRTGPGTSDGGASPLTAVYQAVTGEGDRVDDRVFVEPGQDAEFRPKALKITMIAADTHAHYGGQRIGDITNPGPTFESTIAALLAHDVRAVGLAIGTDPYGALVRLAEGSKTFAPVSGVDCDGDGRRDVQDGKALVCLLESGAVPVSGSVNGQPLPGSGDPAKGLTAAFVGLANGQPDVQPVVLHVAQTATHARLVSAPSHIVDLHADNRLAYEVELSCPRSTAGSHESITLTASAAGRHLATGAIALTCDALPARGLLPVVPPLRPISEIAPAPPAPGQPVPNVNPNPNPNVNPAANVNANPAVADQSEQQSQLAFAENDAELGGEAVQMSAFTGGAALLLCAAGSVAVRRRRQEHLATSLGSD